MEGTIFQFMAARSIHQHPDISRWHVAYVPRSKKASLREQPLHKWRNWAFLWHYLY